MQVQRFDWTCDAGWLAPIPVDADPTASLILSFGPVDSPDADWFADVAARWPGATHVYCSGGGQISQAVVDDDRVTVSVLHFTTATVHAVQRDGVAIERSHAIGTDIGRSFADLADLQHVLVFAEGLSLNGAQFVDGLNTSLPAHVSVSGGLASNGPALTRTVVGLNGVPAPGRVVAIGLAGESLRIGTGSVGGWDHFGPERIVSRSNGTVVYTLDGEIALQVYKRYLGAFASELPGSALLFPLAVRAHAEAPVTVRTILSIDEAEGSLRFAGDIAQGSTVRLMRATTDKLIDGAGEAARAAHASNPNASLTLCISCIGRRAIMRSRVEEETEEVVLVSAGSPVIGFYGNGEIAPPSDGRDFARAVLHNQTMTITTIGEL